MSIEAVETFREKINVSQELQAELRACVVRNGAIDPATIVGLGRENGFDFTTAELESVLGGGELSDFELELVAAGLRKDDGGHDGGRRFKPH
ncbi:MAG: Nif11-like leader peptide family RiPP precursor [Alphaproteobacteria bacterium]|nr:Nif11-like leader peptide family RiPP precursor [Alphaproteobacteria bacterium]